MPNYCNFTISVGGRTENVNQFIDILSHNYDKVHMYRIFESIPHFINNYGMYTHAQIYGDCAWSVASCMLPGSWSYYDADFNRCKNNEVDRFYDWKNKRTTIEVCTMYNFNGTHLLELAKALNLTIQVYSTEPGMCFSEDIKILPNGKMIRNDCNRYEEWWIEDYSSYHEMLDDFGMNEKDCPFSEEEFNNLKDNHASYWEYNEHEFEDEVPDQPKYLVHNLLYKLRKD